MERYTREPSAPPLPNQASCRPKVVMQLLLAANPNSLVRAAGTLRAGSTCQLRPPSAVIRIRNRPLTGSLSTSPRRRPKKAMQS